MIRNILRLNLCDIPGYPVIREKIFLIGFLRILVPLTGKNTLSTNSFEPHAHAANPGKKINKCKQRVISRIFQRKNRVFLKKVKYRFAWNNLTLVPAIDCPAITSGKIRHLPDGKTGFSPDF